MNKGNLIPVRCFKTNTNNNNNNNNNEAPHTVSSVNRNVKQAEGGLVAVGRDLHTYLMQWVDSPSQRNLGLTCVSFYQVYLSARKCISIDPAKYYATALKRARYWNLCVRPTLPVNLSALEMFNAFTKEHSLRKKINTLNLAFLESDKLASALTPYPDLNHIGIAAHVFLGPENTPTIDKYEAFTIEVTDVNQIPTLIKFIKDNKLQVQEKIRGIDLSRIDYSNNTHESIDLLLVAAQSFPHLQTLSFGDIFGPLTLPDFPHLQTLSFGDIRVALTLPDFPNLQNLTFGNIFATLSLPNFPHLQTLTFGGSIYRRLTLLNFPQLQTLSFGDIHAALRLPNFPHLQTLSFGAIGAALSLPNFPHLQNLTFGDIHAALRLPNFPHLQTLSFGDIHPALTLPNFLHLQNLTFGGSIYRRLTLPENLKPLLPEKLQSHHRITLKAPESPDLSDFYCGLTPFYTSAQILRLFITLLHN